MRLQAAAWGHGGVAGTEGVGVTFNQVVNELRRKRIEVERASVDASLQADLRAHHLRLGLELPPRGRGEVAGATGA